MQICLKREKNSLSIQFHPIQWNSFIIRINTYFEEKIFSGNLRFAHYYYKALFLRELNSLLYSCENFSDHKIISDQRAKRAQLFYSNRVKLPNMEYNFMLRL